MYYSPFSRPNGTVRANVKHWKRNGRFYGQTPPNPRSSIFAHSIEFFSGSATTVQWAADTDADTEKRDLTQKNPGLGASRGFSGDNLAGKPTPTLVAQPHRRRIGTAAEQVSALSRLAYYLRSIG
jgi:hypothetical protein